MRRSGRRVGSLAGVALVAAVAAWPGEARADVDFDPAVQYYWLIGGPIAVTATIPFAVVDIVYGAQGSWLPPAWAGTQIGIGATANLAVFGMGAVFMGMTDSPEELTPVFAFSGTFGLWFLTHGILSAVHYEPPEGEDPDTAGEPDEDDTAIVVEPMVAPTSAGLRVRF